MSTTGDESVLGSTATSPTEQGGGGAGTAASRRRGLATTTTPPVLLPTALATAAVVPSHSHGSHDGGSGAPPPTRLLRPRTKTTSPTITPHRAFAIHVCGGRCCRGTWLGLRCWGCFGPYRLRPWSMVRSWQDAFDLAFDAVGWVVERAVYGLGPILIVLALSIAGLLTHTFATILIPMWQDKYRNASVYLLVAVVCAHGAIVATLLGNVLFNYYYCVITPHSGPTFDATVRALATATGVVYPETPTEVEAFRHEFEDKMVLRMRRRHARSLEQQQRQQQQMQPPSLPAAGLAPPVPPSSEPQQHAVGVVPAPLPNGTAAAPGGGPSTDTAAAPPPLRATPTALPSKPPPPPPPPATLPLRGWMLLGPYEWGFCGHSHQPKPPRSHYDHVSKQLVLNLDHYCPWMFNSIGYFNYRYFVNFLLYVFLGMLYGALVTAEPFLWLGTPEYKRQYHRDRQPPDVAHGAMHSTHVLSGQSPPLRLVPMLPFAHERMLLSLSFMLCVAVGLAVLLLGGFHAYLVCTAQTTIEFHANWSLRRRDPTHKNPYSLGSWRRNFAQVYGSQYASSQPGRRPWWTAFGPSKRPPGALPVPVPPGRETVGGGGVVVGDGADSTATAPRRRTVGSHGKDHRPYAVWEV